MAKFFGIVGYGKSAQGKMGVWQDVITERKYYGDVVRNARRLQSNADLNDDVVPDNSISIMADPYALDHFMAIRFVEWAGVFWSVALAEAEHPRIILRLGGVYNGPRAESAGEASSSPGGNIRQ